MVRATSCGIYHLSFLINSFTYIDAIIVDVPIFDEITRGKTINTFDITQRLDRVLIFKTYLDTVWESAKFKDTHFVWPQRSKELEIEIDRIKSKNQTNRR